MLLIHGYNICICVCVYIVPEINLDMAAPEGNPNLSEAQRLYAAVQLRMATQQARPTTAVASRRQAEEQRRKDEARRRAKAASDVNKQRAAERKLKRARFLDGLEEEFNNPLWQNDYLDRGSRGLVLHDTIDYLTGRPIGPPVQWVSVVILVLHVILHAAFEMRSALTDTIHCTTHRHPSSTALTLRIA